MRCARTQATGADELVAIGWIAPQEFLREVRKIETVEAALPSGNASHGAPPFADGLLHRPATRYSLIGCASSPELGMPGLPSFERQPVSAPKPPERRNCALHVRLSLGTTPWREPICWHRPRGYFRQTSCTLARSRPSGRPGQETPTRFERRHRPGFRIRLGLMSPAMRPPPSAGHDQSFGRISA